MGYWEWIWSLKIDNWKLKTDENPKTHRDMPIIMLIVRDKSYTKSINALEQIVARGGRPLVICTCSDFFVLNFVILDPTSMVLEVEF